MKKKFYIIFIACCFGWTTALQAQNQNVNPKLYYNDEKGFVIEGTEIKEGQAPLAVTFQANPTGLEDWTAAFEWHFYRTTKNSARREVLTRYEENTEYTFRESGSYEIELVCRIYREQSDTLTLPSKTMTVEILESKLSFPNAFSPNGDGINDIYRADPDYKSIVSFKAIILNRWGQKLYEWDNPAGGWNGKVNGHDAKDGTYFVIVTARGADGHEYDFRKDVNLLRGYTNNGTSTTGK